MSVTMEEGRRDRKKRQTREAISDAAARLFCEHGFESVSLAQVAEAADVSVKTVFNHFGSKEDLFFDRTEELRDSLVRTIEQRRLGTSALDSLRTLLVDHWIPFEGATWDRLTAEAFAVSRRFLVTEEQSPALRARRLVLERELGATVGEAVARDLGFGPDDATARVLTALVAAILQLRGREFAAATLAGLAPDQVRVRVTEVVSEAFRRLAAAFPDLGK